MPRELLAIQLKKARQDIKPKATMQVLPRMENLQMVASRRGYKSLGPFSFL
jgi:DNA-binding IscR family transcriptional regulator